MAKLHIKFYQNWWSRFWVIRWQLSFFIIRIHFQHFIRKILKPRPLKSWFWPKIVLTRPDPTRKNPITWPSHSSRPAHFSHFSWERKIVFRDISREKYAAKNCEKNLPIFGQIWANFDKKLNIFQGNLNTIDNSTFITYVNKAVFKRCFKEYLW